MSEAESGGQLSPDDMAAFIGDSGAGEAAEGAAEAPGPQGIMGMLRSTEPPVTPAELGHELDMGAEWWEHLGCLFVKASGSGGTEAWMHGVMALLLLALEMQNPADEAEETPDEGTADTDPDGVETFSGPQ